MRKTLFLLTMLAGSAVLAWRSSRRQEPALFRRTQDRLTFAAVPTAAEIDVPSS